MRRENILLFSVNQNKTIRKYVKTGKLLTNIVEITGGLNNGEQIKITVQQNLADYSFLQIIN